MRLFNIFASIACMCAAMFSANDALADAQMSEDDIIFERDHNPRRVRFSRAYDKNVIVIVTNERSLYLSNGDGTALRFPIAVGREGFAWSGKAYVHHKAECPEWNPPKEMIERKPELEWAADGVAGCIPENPLGTHALYLFDFEGKDTLVRIHGTNDPKSIRTAASSGCFRMYNAHIAWVYERITEQMEVYVFDDLPRRKVRKRKEQWRFDWWRH